MKKWLHNQKGKAVVAGLVLFVLVVAGTAFLSNSRISNAGLPDLFGKSQPPLPKGALQIQDLQADPKAYTGRITVRGVIAKVSPTDPNLFALIDSREARVCHDLQCAKWYLPVSVKAGNLKLWDEVNVYGTVTEDADRKLIYLLADKVDNLGSIKP